MPTSRRTVLRLLAASGLLAGLGPGRPAAAAPTTAASTSVRPLWLGANADAARQYALGAFDAAGDQVFEVELPGRGHGLAAAPDRRRAVAVARRPGTFAAVIDLAAGAAVHWLETPPGRHFHGHAAFSADGRVLFTAENDYDQARGVIGVWDAADRFRRLGELDSGGIEPHDLRLMPDGRTLVVANGGILTHPEHGRERLNLEAMDSSLAMLEVRSGALRGQWRLGERLQSIRHLAVGADGTVVVGLQYQGPESEVRPVVAVRRPGGGLAELPLPAAEGLPARARNYCGSVTVDGAGAVAATSFPRGGLIALWRLADGACLGTLAVADGCGVAAGPGPAGVVASSGRGGAALWTVNDGLRPLTGAYVGTRRWDNHLLRVA